MTPLKLALLGAAASLGLAAPAAAQMNHANMPGMNMPGMTMPMPAKKPAAKKPAAKKSAAKKPVAKGTAAKKEPAKKASTKAPAKKAAAPTKADPHAGHDMSSMPGMQMPKDQAGSGSSAQSMPGHDMSSMPGMTMPQGQQGTSGTQGMPSMPGHDMSSMPGMTMPPGQGAASSTSPTTAMPGMNMPGHDMSSMPGMAMPGQGAAVGTDLPAGTAPPPPFPVANAADQVYGPAAMEMGRHHLQQFHGGQKFFQALVNIAEAQFGKGPNGFQWDGEAWYGGDINRLWLKSEGEGTFRDRVDKAEVQALYSRAIGPYFNLQAGARYDLKPNPSRVFATAGIEGLAPSFFELEAALFLSNKGELLARTEGYYDQRITQRLILQPRAELNFAAQNTREIGVGAGLSDAEIGLRLRYEFRREFAPYVGVQYRRAFGRTRDYLRQAGEEAGGWSLLTGIRTWF